MNWQIWGRTVLDGISFHQDETFVKAFDMNDQPITGIIQTVIINNATRNTKSKINMTKRSDKNQSRSAGRETYLQVSDKVKQGISRLFDILRIFVIQTSSFILSLQIFIIKLYLDFEIFFRRTLIKQRNRLQRHTAGRGTRKLATMTDLVKSTANSQKMAFSIIFHFFLRDEKNLQGLWQQRFMTR